MHTRLSVTEMVRDFSGYIHRVTYCSRRFVLVKGRKPIAEIRPLAGGVKIGELERVLRSLPGLTPTEAEAFAKDLDRAQQGARAEELQDPRQS